MILGNYNLLEVVRESDIAYVLTDGTTEIFLHKKEALEPYLPGDKINVFLYVDNQGRPTASTKEPFVTTTKSGFLDVVEISYKYGVFLNNNLIKDLLLSLDDLPLEIDSWPRIGDRLFVIMKEKKSHLFAKFLGRKQVSYEFKEELEDLSPTTIVDAYIQYITEEGYVAFTEKGEEIFIHYNNCREKYRIGQLVHPKILKMNPNGEYTASLIEQKEKMIDSDSQIILTYLENHLNQMRFTDKSSPEDIASAFGMSKSAFKRALGSLYKSGKITLFPDKTLLKK